MGIFFYINRVINKNKKTHWDRVDKSHPIRPMGMIGEDSSSHCKYEKLFISFIHKLDFKYRLCFQVRFPSLVSLFIYIVSVVSTGDYESVRDIL